MLLQQLEQLSEDDERGPGRAVAPAVGPSVLGFCKGQAIMGRIFSILQRILYFAKRILSLSVPCYHHCCCSGTFVSLWPALSKCHGGVAVGQPSWQPTSCKKKCSREKHR